MSAGSSIATALLLSAALAASQQGPAILSSEAATFTLAQATATPTLPSPTAFRRGITYADWRNFNSPRSGLYSPAAVQLSLTALAQTGANWISLVVGCGQEKISSTVITCSPPRTASDEELKYVVRRAHELGMRVLLKPQLDLSNEADPALFRGSIGSAFKKEDQWAAWFQSYRNFIGHYAAFSRDAGVDMLSIGVELGGVTAREADWRRIVAEVREVFPGQVTYASLSSTGRPAPHGEEVRIKWWDAVDVMTDKNRPTVAELKAAWTSRGHLSLLEGLSRKFKKPILFTEFGYRSADGTNRVPGVHRGEPLLDLQEQADAYQAALEVLWGRPWLGGLFWWQWFAHPNAGGPTDNGFTPFGKPAERVLSDFYHRP